MRSADDDLEREVHHWRGLFTPVKTELQLMQRQHPELTKEIAHVLQIMERKSVGRKPFH